jgi:diguanylate cyclase (GGDEF)-like protein
MSMYRQLWLALILSTTLSLVGGFLASTLGARVYLQEQLRLKNNDTAAALALSLSRGGVDAIEMELGVAALFDSGYFRSIKIVDPKGETIVERVAPPAQEDAPQWFVRSLPISAPAGEAKISDGWKQLGTVVLISENSFAYQTLWNATKELIAALFFAGMVGAYLGTLILRRLKKPLAKVIEQARAISDRRFFTTPEPKVPELRQLVAAMNSSVVRLKGMFDEEASRLDTVRREANHDALTGLTNRTHFMASLHAFLDNEEGQSGHLFLIRVANLADVNRRLGRDTTDALLKNIGKTISDFADPLPNSLSARLNGADFAVMLPGAWDARSIADELMQQLVYGASAFLPNQSVAFIGIGSFYQGENMGALLARVDSALANAEAAGNGIVESAVPGIESVPNNADEWGRMIGDALESGRTKLALFPVVDFAGKLIHRESALRLKLTDDGEWLPAGRFLSIAERLGMTTLLDLTVVKLGLDELTKNLQLPGLAINLSGKSIQDITFRAQLKALLSAHPVASRRMWLEVPEHGAISHLQAFRSFCQELAGSGCHLGIEHFGHQFSQIGKLHDLGLNYLKVDASFIREIENNTGNQAFLKGMGNIVHLINLQVIAEGVVSEAELDVLRSLDFDGATGPAIKDPA